MVPLIRRLFEILERDGVLYCHWKSNAFLDLAVQGEDDLDLLVGPAHRQAFLVVLNRLGFKEARVTRPSHRVTGIHDYYGYDETEGRLVHVHAHDRLIVGHDATKNYHLPVEDAYLRSAVRGEYARIPAPEFELVVLVVRMMLKHSTWNAILNGQGRLSDRERRELDSLRAQVTRGQTDSVLERHVPFVKRDLWERCLQALEPGCSLGYRIKVGYRIQRALRTCRRRPAALDNWLQFWRRVTVGLERRLIGNVPDKTMASGGLLAAFIGGDGAGKSTVIDGIAAWLSPPFVLYRAHMGKPAWSLTTIVTRGLLKTGRSLRLYPFSRVPPEVCDAGGPIDFPGYPTLIRSVCTARDRHLAYKKARRRSDQGAIVICDRFPLPRLTFLDGPEIGRMSGSHRPNGLIRLLERLEERYYRSISPPDLLCVLKADPETAVRRKQDEDAAYVRARTREFWKTYWEGAGAHVIDANEPLADVLQKTRALLWTRL